MNHQTNDTVDKEYHLKCQIKIITISTEQERLEKHHKELMETKLVCFVIEDTTQATMWLDDHVYQGAYDVVEVIEDELNIETIAIVPFPIDKPVRISYCAGRREIAKRHFVLMTETLEDMFYKMDGQTITINIRPSSEFEIHGV
ncbi:MAG: hypothetical protein COT84_01975 [Chlamydiae bacterium CG10_big_fil_rev_8_21_14_0_10_35_9]|nr:MAG: hypothetical protein COT84_01975 [Chlamydiae bacterium CG10_big_fil_rev_8_21_14_0_10_35_9]